ncbi:MAG: ATP-dependent helicase, partial [Calditrichales bacterium]
GMTRRKLVEFIKNKANVDDRKIDDVQVMDIYSFITVPFREAEQILEAFKKENTGKRKLVEVANTKDKSQRRK